MQKLNIKWPTKHVGKLFKNTYYQGNRLFSRTHEEFIIKTRNNDSGYDVEKGKLQILLVAM